MGLVRCDGVGKAAQDTEVHNGVVKMDRTRNITQEMSEKAMTVHHRCKEGRVERAFCYHRSITDESSCDSFS